MYLICTRYYCVIFLSVLFVEASHVNIVLVISFLLSTDMLRVKINLYTIKHRRAPLKNAFKRYCFHYGLMSPRPVANYQIDEFCRFIFDQSKPFVSEERHARVLFLVFDSGRK